MLPLHLHHIPTDSLPTKNNGQNQKVSQSKAHSSWVKILTYIYFKYIPIFPIWTRKLHRQWSCDSDCGWVSLSLVPQLIVRSETWRAVALIDCLVLIIVYCFPTWRETHLFLTLKWMDLLSMSGISTRAGLGRVQCSFDWLYFPLLSSKGLWLLSALGHMYVWNGYSDHDLPFF